MKTVSRFEANLLRILQGFFGGVSSDQVLRLVATELRCPRCLSRNAVELVKDTLQKGVPYYLAQQGAWKRERFLRNEQIADGRLWNRTPPEQLGFTFSKQSLQFLIWITANHPNRPEEKFAPDEDQLTIGDRFLFYLAFEALRGTDPIRGLLDQPPFANHSLLWLTALSDLMEYEIQTPKPLDFTSWVSGAGAYVIESLQTRLAERWQQMEAQKIRINQPDIMRQLGRRQTQILTQFFDACEQAERRDLCRFFLHAIDRFLRVAKSREATGNAGLHRLEMKDMRLADRMEVYQSAAAGFRQMERLSQWNRTARGIGFYDEGYTAAQLWKADWEQFEGDRIAAEVNDRLSALELLGRPPQSKTPRAANNPNPTDSTSN